MSSMDCPHLSACPGCPRFAQPGPSEVARRRLEAVCQRFSAAPPTFEMGQALGYRYRSRLAVRGRTGRAKIGIFKAGSHRVVDIPQCPIHHPAINEFAQLIKRGIRELNLVPYSESTHTGLIRYLQLAVQPADSRVQVAIVCNTENVAEAASLFEYVKQHGAERLHSLWFNSQCERDNAIVGPTWQLIHGEPWLCDKRKQQTLYYHPGAFRQSHWQLAGRLSREARTWLEPSQSVAEFYAGVGAIGLGLLSPERRVRFNEVSSPSLAGLRRGLEDLPELAASRAEVWPGPAGSALEMLDGVDGVLVDPPRKGLDAALLRALASAPARRLVYVSCGLDSFARDAEQLIESGGWRLQRVTGWDLFPYTEHVESLALFSHGEV